MKTDPCLEARTWLAHARERGDDAPVGVAFHVSRCDRCGALAARYQAGVRALAAVTARTDAGVPSFGGVRRALVADRARAARRRVGLVVGLVAVAAALVVVTRGGATGGGATGGSGAAAVARAPLAWPVLAAPTLRPPVEAWDVDPSIAEVTTSQGAEVEVTAWSREAAELVVTRGRVRTQVRPRLVGDRFVVTTPLVSVSAIGTDFTVEHDPARGTTVSVSEGVVLVEAPDRGLAVTVDAGRSLLIPIVAPPATTTGTPAAPAPAEASEAPAAALQRARGLLTRGRAREAAALVGELLPAAGGLRPQALALLGDARRVSGDLAGAAEAYAQAAALGPTHARARAFEDLADVHTTRGDVAAARAAWESYLTIDPDGHAAARALLALGRDAELLAAHPGSREATTALLRLGRARLSAGDWGAAAELFAAHVDSGDATRAEGALVGLLRARVGQGRLDEARALVQRYRARFPSGRRASEVDLVERALTPR